MTANISETGWQLMVQNEQEETIGNVDLDFGDLQYDNKLKHMKLRVKNLKGAYIELSVRATNKQINFLNKSQKYNRMHSTTPVWISQDPVHYRKPSSSFATPTSSAPSGKKGSPNSFVE